MPSGLHYRLNLSTGKKEAKILDPEDEKTTAMQKSENQEEEEEVEGARNRLEEALKNIPSEKFDDVTEEKFKEISKKFRSYDQIKEELKEINVVPKTEAEVLMKLMAEFLNSTAKIEILNDLEFLIHSIDNALLFISANGVETILAPSLVNQTDLEVQKVALKIFGVMLQNNPQGKKFVSEKTNLVHEMLTIFARSLKSNGEELSTAIYATGSLLRNNNFVTGELRKKFFTILMELLSKKEIFLHLKVKTLLLIDDLVLELDELSKAHKFCENLAEFFIENRNGLISDGDSLEKTAASLLNLQVCHNSWKQLPLFRHNLLVVLQNYRARLGEEEDFLNLLIVEHLENLNRELFSELNITGDDLNAKYESFRDEL